MESIEEKLKEQDEKPETKKGASFGEEQPFDESPEGEENPHSRSLADAFSEPQSWTDRIGSALLGQKDDEFTDPTEGLDGYVDAEEHVRGRDVEPIDPTEHKVEYVNTWIDAAIRAGDVDQAREVYQAEKNRGKDGRKGIKEEYDETDFIDEEAGLVDPTNYGVPALQHWMDERLEEGATEMVGLLLEQEGESDARSGVMQYDRLRGEFLEVEEVGDVRPTVESEEGQRYDSIKFEYN